MRINDERSVAGFVVVGVLVDGVVAGGVVVGAGWVVVAAGTDGGALTSVEAGVGASAGPVDGVAVVGGVVVVDVAAVDGSGSAEL